MKQVPCVAAATAIVALAISAVPTTNAGFTRQPTTQYCSANSGDSTSGRASTGAGTRTRTRARPGAAASPLFRSVAAISTTTSGEVGDDTTCVSGDETAASSEKQEQAAAARQRIAHIPTFEDLQQAYYQCENTELTVDTRECSAAVGGSGVFARLRRSRVGSVLAITFNAAVAVLATQRVYLAVLFGGSAASMQGANICGVVDIPVPAATVMRVAPAGANTVTHTAKRSDRFNAETVRTFAGSGAAVAGTLIGRGYFIKREREKDEEEDDVMLRENAERYRRITSSSSDDAMVGSATVAPAPAVSNITSEVGDAVAQVKVNVDRGAYETAARPGDAVVKRQTGESAENVEATHGSKDKDELKVILVTAAKLLHDRETAARDFQRMRSLLEARLKMEAAERDASTTKNDSDEGKETSRRLLQDREAATRDFQLMRSLLEARLRMEAAKRERSKLQDDPCYCATDSMTSSPTTPSRNREQFQQMLLAARIRQDAVDKAAFLQCELEKRERAAAIVEELIELHRRKEVEEMRANAERAERKKPSSITPELMTTIQIMQKDKNPTPSGRRKPIEDADSGCTKNVKKRRLRFALASVVAFFASSLASNDTA